MNVKTEKYHLNADLLLQELSGTSINFPNVTLTMLQAGDGSVPEIRLNLQVSEELYHRIDTQALFNLQPEVRGCITGGSSFTDVDYQLDIALHPDAPI